MIPPPYTLSFYNFPSQKANKNKNSKQTNRKKKTKRSKQHTHTKALETHSVLANYWWAEGLPWSVADRLSGTPMGGKNTKRNKTHNPDFPLPAGISRRNLLGKGWGSLFPSHSRCWKPGWLECVQLSCAAVVPVSTSVLLCPEVTVSLEPPLAFTIFLSPPLHRSMSPEEGCEEGIPFRSERSKVPFAQHTVQLWFLICNKRKPLC